MIKSKLAIHLASEDLVSHSRKSRIKVHTCFGMGGGGGGGGVSSDTLCDSHRVWTGTIAQMI